MSNVKTFRSPGADPGQLPNLGRRAEENLEYIRSTIESGIKFTAVPGYGGILMGLTAIATGYLASAAADFYYWLIYWIFAAALAITIGILAMWRKAARCGQPLLTLSEMCAKSIRLAKLPWPMYRRPSVQPNPESGTWLQRKGLQTLEPKPAVR